MINTRLQIAGQQFDTLYLIENRNYWYSIKNRFNTKTDLVLTLDFAVKYEVEQMGGLTEFFDHIADPEQVNELNYKMHAYMDSWFLNQGIDQFNYRNINFGNSFKLNIFNDVSYTFHFYTALIAIKELKYNKIRCGISDPNILQFISELSLPVEPIPLSDAALRTNYFFPIGKWMKEAIERKSMKRVILNIILLVRRRVFLLRELVQTAKPAYIFVSNYYPTAKVAQKLAADKKIKLVFNSVTRVRDLFSDNLIYYSGKKTHRETKHFQNIFNEIQPISLYIENVDIAPKLHRTLEPIIISLLPKCLNAIDDIISYFEKKELKLMIPVTDLWLENRLVMNYCLANNIPIFMVINGLLTNNSYKDGFDATWVNCYSQAIKEDYYQNAQNALCLGDSRMDFYALCNKKTINRTEPTIVIGTGGYNPIDINSYLAGEYDFLFDILNTLKLLQTEYKFKIIIKVRANGYLSHYTQFVNEYFNNLPIEIVQKVPFIEVVSKADLYFSINSQTLFEAACLGIPSIYYKKDTEINNRPFDTKSELVTPTNPQELKETMLKFYRQDECFEAFMKKEVLEKYIGFLDGKNCERNVEFIYDSIKPNSSIK